MTTIEEDLARLNECAVGYGATRSHTIRSKQVVMDPRVRLKCQVPRCLHYGRNLMCPPNCITPEEFALSLDRYRFGILVQAKVVEDAALVETRQKGELVDLVNNEEYLRQMRASMRSFEKILASLERDALRMGHRFATALSGGTCALCDECAALSPGEHCRHPFEARPSMEAVGIDVVLTASNAGMPIEFPAKDPVWTGLLLIE